MRYYNENPQVTYWREKYEESQRMYDVLKDSVDDFIMDVQYEKDQRKIVEFRVKDALEEFNALPWYKKMFYNFNIWYMLRDIVERQKNEIAELESRIEFQRKLICKLQKILVEMDTKIQELKANEKMFF